MSSYHSIPYHFIILYHTTPYHILSSYYTIQYEIMYTTIPYCRAILCHIIPFQQDTSYHTTPLRNITSDRTVPRAHLEITEEMLFIEFRRLNVSQLSWQIDSIFNPPVMKRIGGGIPWFYDSFATSSGQNWRQRWRYCIKRLPRGVIRVTSHKFVRNFLTGVNGNLCSKWKSVR